MHYKVAHSTTYQYAQAVRLRPHTLLLCPRSDGAQQLEKFDVQIEPSPKQQTYFLDINGNTCIKLSFETAIASLHITTTSEVTTRRENPFDYLSEPWALSFPIDYPSSLAAQLSPYLAVPPGQGIDSANMPAILELAQSVMQEVNGNVGQFLTQLTQSIQTSCDYQQRLEGPALAPAITLSQGSGTCRDFAVLFVAVCRAVGIAARFVSGYQEGDPDGPHDLHAWAEAYVPGGGWRGFDPTLGLAVGDRHIALAAAIEPKQAGPVIGKLYPGQKAETTLESSIELTLLDD